MVNIFNREKSYEISSGLYFDCRQPITIDGKLCGSEVQPVFGAVGVSVVVAGVNHV